ncbi:hypothetical protein L596_018284 [Steinernema carpocapsae]|uniref:Uncharacterized protein n=1 Tax=Steinernema carpocapsae TaxID=34508 RepID=A0A4V6A1Z6_STECR|nr:hypothetical protein L596_018284 [Steinernema carpocapsae]
MEEDPVQGVKFRRIFILQMKESHRFYRIKFDELLTQLRAKVLPQSPLDALFFSCNHADVERLLENLHKECYFKSIIAKGSSNYMPEMIMEFVEDQAKLGTLEELDLSGAWPRSITKALEGVLMQKQFNHLRTSFDDSTRLLDELFVTKFLNAWCRIRKPELNLCLEIHSPALVGKIGGLVHKIKKRDGFIVRVGCRHPTSAACVFAYARESKPEMLLFFVQDDIRSVGNDEIVEELNKTEPWSNMTR